MNDKFVDMPKCMADKYETADFIASDPPRPVPKAVFRAGRGGQWVCHLVALVREPKGDHRGGGADGQGVWWQSLRVADG